MGTSASSKGPRGGVPLVPPWVPGLDAPVGAPKPVVAPDEGASPPTTAPAPAVAPGPVAPAGRFSGTRRSLGAFAKSGDQGRMQRSLGRYVRAGYGGSGGATRRFAGTAHTAGVLFGALSPVDRSNASLPGGSIDVAVLSGRSANEVMDAVVEAVRPTDGTQDAEASRAAIKAALSDLLTKFPDATLLDLADAQRMFAVERYVGLDVYHRFWLDVGKAIQDKAPTVKAGLARLKEVKDYIKATVAAAFKKISVTPGAVTRQIVAKLAHDALKETFTVFESYAI